MRRTSFTDLIFLLMFGFMFLVVVMIAHLNPPESESVDSSVPGNLIVLAEWPEGNIDVDLWVTGPGERQPVGYSNKSGVLWNLLRDDLGDRPDATPSNFENMYSRGLVPGEYVINLHLYRAFGEQIPVPVDVEISVKRPDPTNGGKDGIQVLAYRQVLLTAEKQERTVIRFRLDANGNIVDGSVNNLYRPMKNSPGNNPGMGDGGDN